MIPESVRAELEPDGLFAWSRTMGRSELLVNAPSLDPVVEWYEERPSFVDIVFNRVLSLEMTLDQARQLHTGLGQVLLDIHHVEEGTDWPRAVPEEGEPW